MSSRFFLCPLRPSRILSGGLLVSALLMVFAFLWNGSNNAAAPKNDTPAPRSEPAARPAAAVLPVPAAKPPADDYRRSEFPARPAPYWVRMIDQGQYDRRLKGIRTPAGIRVEIVAEEPTVIDPVAMSFDENGRAYVIEWRHADGAKHGTYTVTFRDGTTGIVNRMYKAKKDVFKRLFDRDRDGRYESSRLLMDDLEMPSMALRHNGWWYFPSVGHVIRRRRSQPGGPFDVEEEIIRGLCGFHHHQVSGLTLTPDGWLLVSSGDDDNRGEGSDGSRATVLRTGAVFLSRPDGSKLQEFARGFRNPYRNVEFDEFFNIFHVDNDNEDGSKFQGCRLMHVMEGADYGWRLLPGAVCCRPDHARGAVFGERPGTVPAMLKTGRGSPAGLLIYKGTKFPAFFRGLLIYADVFRKRIRAYQVRRDGATFQVTRQFTLMESDDGLFRPCQALVGPDGAIYIVDWRTDSGGAGRLWGDTKHGRIYRLSWRGLPGHPAIPLDPPETWAKIGTAPDERLWRLLEDPDFEKRLRAQRELVRRAKKDRQRTAKTRKKFLVVALDAGKSPQTRAVALSGACHFYNAEVQSALLRLLRTEKHPELLRLAAELMGRNAPPPLIRRKTIEQLVGPFTEGAEESVIPALVLAFGKLLHRSSLPQREKFALACELWSQLKATAGRTMQQKSPGFWSGSPSEIYQRNAVLRALEMQGAIGLRAITADLKKSAAHWERELVVSALEGLRTRAAAKTLDSVLAEHSDVFTDDQLARLLTAYRFIQVEPPLSTAGIVRWLEKHPHAGAPAQVAALETIGLMGGSRSKQLRKIAARLVNHREESIRLGAIRAIGNNRLNTLNHLLITALRDVKRSVRERREIVAALSNMRSVVLPFNNQRTPKGVEAVLDDLQRIARNPQQGPLRADVLVLIAQVDFRKAEPVAQEFLNSGDILLQATAINVLGAKPQHARDIARRFLAGKIDRALLPRVADVLQRHRAKDRTGEISKLLNAVYKGGLLASLKKSDRQRLESLVTQMGDPQRGMKIFLANKRAQCITCHRLEGVGGQVGPDLSGVHKALTIPKIVESILDPSKEIKEGYATWIVVTHQGQVFTGLKVSADRRQIVLRDATGKDIRLLATQIEQRVQSRKSLMPDGAVLQLSLQEFLDLVAFLKDRSTQLELRRHAARRNRQPASHPHRQQP